MHARVGPHQNIHRARQHRGDANQVVQGVVRIQGLSAGGHFRSLAHDPLGARAKVAAQKSAPLRNPRFQERPGCDQLLEEHPRLLPKEPARQGEVEQGRQVGGLRVGVPQARVQVLHARPVRQRWRRRLKIFIRGELEDRWVRSLAERPGLPVDGDGKDRKQQDLRRDGRLASREGRVVQGHG